MRATVSVPVEEWQRVNRLLEMTRAEAAQLRQNYEPIALGAGQLRPEVLAFAGAIEERLRANEHKGNWKECDLAYLAYRTAEEYAELLKATVHGGPAEVLAEAADVAAFALFFADNFGELMAGAR